MASWAIRLVVTAAFLGSAAGSSILTLPGGALLKEREAPLEAESEAEGAADRNTQREISLGSEEGEHVDTAFDSFLAKHHRKYEHGTDEYAMRKALFKQRLLAVHAHNAKPNHERRWKAAPSYYSDRTEAERKAVRGYKKGAHSAHRAGSLLQTGNQSRRQLPAEKSWTHLAVANKVKDQGACGSCWAVATISILEAHYEIYSAKGGAVRSFSAQQTVDCTPNPDECGGKGGCQGATVELGMAWILKNGLATEEQVAYKAQDQKCTVNAGGGSDSHSGTDSGSGSGDNTFQVLARTSPDQSGGASFGLKGYHTLTSNAGYPLREALALYGPVAVSASAGAWFEYHSGVFDGCDKDSVVDHAITAYGYGKEGDQKYWLIRNSWGNTWGENGFIRLLRHDDDEKYCGTDDDPAQGLGCKGGPASVTVCGMCGVLYDSVVPYFQGSPGHGSGASAGAMDDVSLTQSTDDIRTMVESNPEKVMKDEASSARIELNGEVMSITGSVDTDAISHMVRAEANRH